MVGRQGQQRDVAILVNAMQGIPLALVRSTCTALTEDPSQPPTHLNQRLALQARRHIQQHVQRLLLQMSKVHPPHSVTLNDGKSLHRRWGSGWVEWNVGSRGQRPVGQGRGSAALKRAAGLASELKPTTSTEPLCSSRTFTCLDRKAAHLRLVQLSQRALHARLVARRTRRHKAVLRGLDLLRKLLEAQLLREQEGTGTDGKLKGSA